MVKPCILSDWLTGSAGAMLESNWVRVCELEERSLNVSHCCRRQTDSERKHVSQPVQWHHTFTSSVIQACLLRRGVAGMAKQQRQAGIGKKTRHRWLSDRTADSSSQSQQVRENLLFDDEVGIKSWWMDKVDELTELLKHGKSNRHRAWSLGEITDHVLCACWNLVARVHLWPGLVEWRHGGRLVGGDLHRWTRVPYVSRRLWDFWT